MLTGAWLLTGLSPELTRYLKLKEGGRVGLVEEGDKSSQM